MSRFIWALQCLPAFFFFASVYILINPHDFKDYLYPMTPEYASSVYSSSPRLRFVYPTACLTPPFISCKSIMTQTGLCSSPKLVPHCLLQVNFQVRNPGTLPDSFLPLTINPSANSVCSVSNTSHLFFLCRSTTTIPVETTIISQLSLPQPPNCFSWILSCSLLIHYSYCIWNRYKLHATLLKKTS